MLGNQIRLKPAEKLIWLKEKGFFEYFPSADKEKLRIYWIYSKEWRIYFWFSRGILSKRKDFFFLIIFFSLIVANIGF